MNGRGKKYQAVKKKAPTEVVDIATAVTFLKENTRDTFDESVEAHLNLGINPTKSDQMVRGSVIWPHGSAKAKRVAVITDDTTLQDEAKAAGATIAGGEDLLADIAEKSSLDADVVVATPNMMPKIARVAKVLGPKGLMPNPKTGTVTPDPVKAVKELLAGKATFKMDQLGNIHEAVAKVSWDAKKIEENIDALIEAVRQARPVAQKGEYIKNVTLTTTMGPGVKVSL